MRVGTLKISRGALLLLAWLLYRDNNGILWQGFLACLLHELGHIVAIKVIQKDIKCISITVIGAKIDFKGNIGYLQEIFVAAAGPGSNLLMALVFCQWRQTQCFAGMNLVLTAFNLLPVGTLDGGRILRCFLAMCCTENAAPSFSVCLDFCFTAILGCLGLWATWCFRNPTLFFVALWLFSRCIHEKKI